MYMYIYNYMYIHIVNSLDYLNYLVHGHYHSDTYAYKISFYECFLIIFHTPFIFAMIPDIELILCVGLTHLLDTLVAYKYLNTNISSLYFDSSPLLWVHAVLAVAFLILLVGLMRHFRVNLEFEEDEQVSRTLMISGIPKDKCFKNQITQHFE